MNEVGHDIYNYQAEVALSAEAMLRKMTRKQSSFSRSLHWNFSPYRARDIRARDTIPLTIVKILPFSKNEKIGLDSGLINICASSNTK